DPTVASELEVLRLAMFRRLRIANGLGEAYALDRLLLDAVQLTGRGNPAQVVQGRHKIDRVNELITQPAFLLDTCWPRDDHWIPRAAEVTRDLLGPLERRVHRVRPGGGKMIEMLGPAEFVDGLQVVLPVFQKPVEEH